MKLNKYFFILPLLIMFFNAAAYSQWTGNTAVNTVVCDTNGEQSVSKLALCPDGTTYYSWFDNRGGSYAVYLQRLDANGNRMFPSAGVLVSSNPQNSSLVDWDLIADNNNNAIVTFTDIRSGGTITPFAYMISPTGVQMWGANGVTLSDSINSFQPNPKVVQTSDGNYVFFWRIGSGPQKLAMQKLNAAGVKQWGSSPVIWTSGTTENFDWPSLIASDAGSVILMFSGYTGTFISPSNYKIYSQKLNSAGVRQWSGADTLVYSLGRVTGFYQPRIFSDGMNGAIYCWVDDRTSSNWSMSYLQRKNLSGANQFPLNGSTISNDGSNKHFTPVASYMSATGETIAICQEANGGQTLWGMYAQKFSAAGAQMWGANGLPIIPLGANQPGIMTVLTRDTNAIAYTLESQGAGNDIVRAFRLGKSGGIIWSTVPGSLLSPKLRLNAVINSTSGMSIMSWQDNRTGPGGVYAQNIAFDGTFVGIGSNNNSAVPEKFELRQNYPNPFNPSTTIKFGLPKASYITLKIYDISGKEALTVINNRFYPKGEFNYNLNISNLASGVYFYSLFADDAIMDTKKMLMIK